MMLMSICVYLIALSFSSCLGARGKRADDTDFQCPEQNGMYADPKSCRRFYQCVETHPYVSRCPSSLYFDDVTKFCTFENEARCGPIAATPAPNVTVEEKAKSCNPAECQLPNCYCSSDGTIIPGGLEPSETPQMILITMDDAINDLNINSYRKVFNNRTNPNGCPIKGTFFVAHEYTNYQLVQTLYSEGHEIGVYSVSNHDKLEEADYNEWVNETVGMREMLRLWANVSKTDIFGTRAPHLKPGRNAQYEVLTDYGFAWDSSLSTPPLTTPIWPYTLDYAIPHECRSGTCPTRAFPGIWEIPMNSHFVDGLEGGYCPYLDQCVLEYMDGEEVFQWLKEDFTRYYEGNRAPYVMAFHTSWFQTEGLEQGLTTFLDWAGTKDDIWFQTTTQALLWITEPTPISQIGSFETWDCSKRTSNPPKPCNFPNSCALPFNDGQMTDTRYMTTCFSCPRVYPWLGDAAGKGKKTADIYDPETPK